MHNKCGGPCGMWNTQEECGSLSKWLRRFPSTNLSLGFIIRGFSFSLELHAPPPIYSQEPWKGISQITPLFLPQIKYSLNDGSKILFWLDKWAGLQPLSALFPSIFNLCLTKTSSSQIFMNAQIRISNSG